MADGGTIIPVRLQKFLGTTTRRDGIWNTRVAAVIVKDRMFAVDQNNALPCKEVEDWDVEKALEDVLGELDIEASLTSYLGSTDYLTPKGRTRQYNFLIKPASAKEMRYVGIDELANDEEKKAVELIFRKEPARA